MEKKRIRDYGYKIGNMEPGKLNKITDITGVRVGHCTVADERHNTGVTVIIPGDGNLITDKVTAAVHVINGFGKTAGLMQVKELGSIETPIALTGTVNVGLVFDALVQYSLDRCHEDGYNLWTVNPIVGETNDVALNDISERTVGYNQVMRAINSATVDFEEGAVGAGRGTTCYGLKGGIGSASRVIDWGNGLRYTVGALVQSNFGITSDLTVCGDNIGKRIVDKIQASKSDKGSIMVVIGCDLPVDSRMLERMCRRAVVGLARTGSFVGHASGDVVIGFTTADRIRAEGDFVTEKKILREDLLETVFYAVAECVEESVLNSLTTSERVSHGDRVYVPLSEYLGKI